MACTRKSEVDSPMAVDRNLMIQNAAVISGTRSAPLVVSHVRISCVIGDRISAP